MAKTSFLIRMESEELEDWRKRAAGAGVSLAAWIRNCCAAAPIMLPTPPIKPVPKPAVKPDSIEAMVAKRTGHEVGCECFQCAQTYRAIFALRKEADSKGKLPRK